MKNLQIYDWAMPAGGSFQLPVEGAYVRILTATGNVNIIGDTFGKLGPVNRGQGLENTPYRRLVIQDASGAPNSGTVLVSEANFIDQTLYGSITLGSAVALDAPTLAALETVNVIYKPEGRTGTYNSSAASTAGTPITIFTPGSNTAGVILLDAHISILESNAGVMAFITKSTAPTSVNDGDIVLASTLDVYGGPCVYSGRLEKERFIKAGEGLYFITTMAVTGSANIKAASWKTL